MEEAEGWRGGKGGMMEDGGWRGKVASIRFSWRSGEQGTKPDTERLHHNAGEGGLRNFGEKEVEGDRTQRKEPE